VRVLVTGGAGYLGSILVGKMLEKGYAVRVLDNLLYGVDSMKRFLANSNFELDQGDIRDMTTIVRALKGVNAVIHLASIVGAQAAGLDPKTTIQINYLATRNIAELCELYEIEKFIFASTCSVYGSQPGRVITEDSRIEPVDFYAETKVRSEKAVVESKMPSTILRLGTLFGLSYRMRFDLAINLFIAKALNKERITVFGGDQHRPFLHVADAADAFIFALEKGLEGVYNVMWDNLSIMDVAKLVSSFVPTEIEVSQRIVDRRNYRVSSERIKGLGFRTRKDVGDAVVEIREAFSQGLFQDYTASIYSNYESLFKSEETQRKVYTLGPIFRQSDDNR